MPYKISIDIDNSNKLNLNLYEVRIESSIIENLSLLEALLFQCKCALFLVDLTRKDSFENVKDLLNVIDFCKFRYLNGIIVFNKSDLINRKNSEIEKLKYLQKNKKIDFIEISIKNNINLKELLKRINGNLNKFILPINIILGKKYKNYLFNSLENITFILLGDSCSGKSCFYERYFSNSFSICGSITIGMDKRIKWIKFDNYIYKLIVWDTAGAERFKSLSINYLNKSNAVLLFFDVTNENSFDNINSWINNIKDNSNDIMIYLIGNKIDLPERKISKERAEELANSFNIKYFEVSCKFNINISEVIFNMILEYLLKINKININQMKIIKNYLNLYYSNKIMILDKYINY